MHAKLYNNICSNNGSLPAMGIMLWGGSHINPDACNNGAYLGPVEFLENKKNEYQSLRSLSLDQDLSKVSAIKSSLLNYPHLTELTIFFALYNSSNALVEFINFLDTVKDRMIKVCLEFNSNYLCNQNSAIQDQWMNVLLAQLSQFSKLKVLLLRRVMMNKHLDFVLPPSLEVFELSGSSNSKNAETLFEFKQHEGHTLQTFKMDFFLYNSHFNNYPKLSMRINEMVCAFSPKNLDLELRFGGIDLPPTLPYCRLRYPLLLHPQVLPNLESLSFAVSREDDINFLIEFFKIYGQKIVNFHFKFEDRVNAEKLIALINPLLASPQFKKHFINFSFSGPPTEPVIHELTLYFLKCMGKYISQFIVPLPELNKSKKSKASLQRAETIKNWITGVEIEGMKIDLFYRIPYDHFNLNSKYWFSRMHQIHLHLVPYIADCLIPMIIEYIFPLFYREFGSESFLAPAMWYLRGWSEEKNWKRNNEREDSQIFELLAKNKKHPRQTLSNEVTMQDEHNGDGVEEESLEKKLKLKPTSLFVFKGGKSTGGSSSSSSNRSSSFSFS